MYLRMLIAVVGTFDKDVCFTILSGRVILTQVGIYGGGINSVLELALTERMFPRRAVSGSEGRERRLDVQHALEHRQTFVCTTLHSVTGQTRFCCQIGVVGKGCDIGGLETVGATPVLIMRLSTGIRIDTEEDAVAINRGIRFLMSDQRRVQTETTLAALLRGRSRYIG